MLGWGLWEWLGADLAEALAGRFDVATFAAGDPPPRDAAAVVVVEHPLPEPH